MEYYFDPDDKLDRRKYAEFLKSMLENCDKYRREDSDGAYVIAIDSPWGTGKTRFAKMLRNYLEDRTKEMKDESLPGKNAAFSAIYYNSWETDFSDDALLPLIYSITKSSEFKAERFKNKSKAVLGKFLDAAAAITKATAYTILHNFAGEKVVELIEAGEEALTKKVSNPLEKYEERLNLLNGFRLSLENVIKQTKQKKLVIVVDELDRCRPTFAIQTLELAKHLFAIPNLVFIFALDIEQLSCSVKTVYGSSMDAAGYLCRFFDYIGKMPNPNQRIFVKMCLEQHRASTSLIENWNQKIPDYFTALSMSFSLSLRDISTIIKTYQLALDSFLLDYKYPQFHLLYLFLLTLKYKDGSLYSDFLLHRQNDKYKKSGDNCLAKVKHYFPDLPKTESTVLSDQLQRLNNTTVLSNVEFGVYPSYIDALNRESRTTPFRVEAAIKEYDIRGNARLIITPKFKDSRGNIYTGNREQIDETDVLSDVIEGNDLVKWDGVKNISLGQYYYQQLEMFNFALTADDSESKA